MSGFELGGWEVAELGHRPADVTALRTDAPPTRAPGTAGVPRAFLSGLRPSPGTAAYGAAKAGLINLTQS